MMRKYQVRFGGEALEKFQVMETRWRLTLLLVRARRRLAEVKPSWKLSPSGFLLLELSPFGAPPRGPNLRVLSDSVVPHRTGATETYRSLLCSVPIHGACARRWPWWFKWVPHAEGRWPFARIIPHRGFRPI